MFVKNRFIGKVSLILEHESNGKSHKASRSWNRISLAANIFIDPTMMIYGKYWIPIVDGENNRDLLDYYGAAIYFDICEAVNGLKFAEKYGFDNKADTQLRAKFIIIEQPLSVTVVKL